MIMSLLELLYWHVLDLYFPACEVCTAQSLIGREGIHVLL
jgi:hypothetical protein